MAMRNYRQAKRNREETRKKRQQEKLAQKQNRAATPVAGQEPPAPAAEVDTKESQ